MNTNEDQDKESFNEAVIERLNRGEDHTGEESDGEGVDPARKNQPALEDQNDEGNPAKTDNE